jgi:hypothetical protein
MVTEILFVGGQSSMNATSTSTSISMPIASTQSSIAPFCNLRQKRKVAFSRNSLRSSSEQRSDFFKSISARRNISPNLLRVFAQNKRPLAVRPISHDYFRGFNYSGTSIRSHSGTRVIKRVTSKPS